MTPQIKQRIDQIRRGEVPEGYKRTKVGIVPKEWEEGFLGTYIQEYKELSNDIEKYPVYSSSRQGLIPQSQYYDNREAVETNLGYKIVPNGYVTYRHMSDDDVFHFNVNNTGGEIFVSSEYPVFSSTEKSSLGYIIPMLNDTAHFRYFCRTQKMGGTRTRLYYKNLCTYKSVYPPLAEQEKIAGILSAQDKLIALKEKLIKEKKRQKKALMQLLLTGKKRLPGFSGEWKKQKMSDILCERKEENKDQSLRICSVAVNSGVVDQREHLGKSMAASDTSNYNVVHYGDIVYTKSPTGAFPYGIVKQSQLTENVAVSPLYGVYEPTSYEIGYLLNEYFMYSNNANGYLLPIINKGAKNTINISNATFITPSLYLPTNFEEIKKLVQIFKVANKEIEILQKDLDQEKQKKKALMQLLLTGIVRVEVNE